jgi:single-strand selective monofunctional uracil DNA glycosylase
MNIGKEILKASKQLSDICDGLSFIEPTHTVYNPLVYAWAPYSRYVETYANNRKKVVFIGMNPGPWGMAQVGVPFGEITMVKDFLNISEPVGKPNPEHPKRPIQGFDCERSEVSGRRLWGMVKHRYGTAANFFIDHFVLNYCPLVFMEDSGKNRTPDKLPPNEREALYEACDKHLFCVLDLLQPEWVIGVGKFAAARIEACGFRPTNRIDWVLHPSPASPAANKDWSGFVEKKLKNIGVW